MKNTYMIEKHEYYIDNEKSLIVETMSDDKLTNYVYYKNSDDLVCVGIFYLSDNCEYLIYNDRYIGINSIINDRFSVDTLFDMDNDCFVESSPKVLLEIFNDIFDNKISKHLIYDGVYTTLENTKRVDLISHKENKVLRKLKN